MSAADDRDDGAGVVVQTLRVGDGGTGVRYEVSPRQSARSTLPNLGPFVGRADDLNAIDTAFDDPARGARLVLAGEAGVGKSHLAVHWGATRQARYPGGTFFIPFNAD